VSKRVTLVFVQCVTLSRAAAAALFVSTVLSPGYEVLATCVYIYALVSDLLDGRLARLLQVPTPGGAALDGFSDKYLTVASVLYIAALGFPLPPCCLLLLRDILVPALRAIRTSGDQIFFPRRFIGGITGTPVRILTLAALFWPMRFRQIEFFLEIGIWIAAFISLASLAWHTWKSREQIKKAFSVQD
jgi:phosphatidylglycerophosphate synthase